MDWAAATELLSDDPAGWREPAVGVLVAAAGAAAVVAGTTALVAAIRDRFGPLLFLVDDGSGVVYLAGWGLIAGLYAIVGVGGTWAYLRVREVERGFVVSLPGRDGWRWLAGTVGLPLAMVGLVVLFNRHRHGELAFGAIPETVFLLPGPPLAAPGLWLDEHLLAGVLAALWVCGSSLGVLVHGVVQRTVQRAASLPVAAGAAALFVAAIELAAHLHWVSPLLVGYAAFVAYADDRTETLLAPAIGYGLLNGATVLAWAFVLASRYNA